MKIIKYFKRFLIVAIALIAIKLILNEFKNKVKIEDRIETQGTENPPNVGVDNTIKKELDSKSLNTDFGKISEDSLQKLEKHFSNELNNK
jgi:hypothetical protein